MKNLKTGHFLIIMAFFMAILNFRNDNIFIYYIHATLLFSVGCSFLFLENIKILQSGLVTIFFIGIAYIDFKLNNMFNLYFSLTISLLFSYRFIKLILEKYFIKIEYLEVNGYKIKYVAFWHKYLVSHDDIGANIAEFKTIKEAIEYAEKG